MNRKDTYLPIKSLDTVYEMIHKGELIFCQARTELSDFTPVNDLISSLDFKTTAESLREGFFLQKIPATKYAKSKELLKDLIPKSALDIANAVCEFYGVPLKGLNDPIERRKLIEVRQVIAVLLTYSLKMRRVDVGQLLHTDQSAVTKGLLTINGLLEVDKVFERKFLKIVDAVNQFNNP